MLPDGTFSKEAHEFDDEGYDVHGFNSKNRTGYGVEYVNGFYRKKTDGTVKYPNKFACSKKYEHLDRDGYDIDGFDMRGFNRDGIHKLTGIRYNPSGISFKSDGTRIPFPLLEALENKDQQLLIEFLVLSCINPKIKEEDWFKAVQARYPNVELIDEVKKNCEEALLSKQMLAEDQKDQVKLLDEQIEIEDKRKQQISQNRQKVALDIEKLVRILKGDLMQDQGGGER